MSCHKPPKHDDHCKPRKKKHHHEHDKHKHHHHHKHHHSGCGCGKPSKPVHTRFPIPA